MEYIKLIPPLLEKSSPLLEIVCVILTVPTYSAVLAAIHSFGIKIGLSNPTRSYYNTIERYIAIALFTFVELILLYSAFRTIWSAYAPPERPPLCAQQPDLAEPEPLRSYLSRCFKDPSSNSSKNALDAALKDCITEAACNAQTCVQPDDARYLGQVRFDGLLLRAKRHEAERLSAARYGGAGALAEMLRMCEGTGASFLDDLQRLLATAPVDPPRRSQPPSPGPSQATSPEPAATSDHERSSAEGSPPTFKPLCPVRPDRFMTVHVAADTRSTLSQGAAPVLDRVLRRKNYRVVADGGQDATILINAAAIPSGEIVEDIEGHPSRTLKLSISISATCRDGSFYDPLTMSKISSPIYVGFGNSTEELVELGAIDALLASSIPSAQ